MILHSGSKAQDKEDSGNHAVCGVLYVEVLNSLTLIRTASACVQVLPAFRRAKMSPGIASKIVSSVLHDPKPHQTTQCASNGEAHHYGAFLLVFRVYESAVSDVVLFFQNWIYNFETSAVVYRCVCMKQLMI